MHCWLLKSVLSQYCRKVQSWKIKNCFLFRSRLSGRDIDCKLGYPRYRPDDALKRHQNSWGAKVVNYLAVCVTIVGLFTVTENEEKKFLVGGIKLIISSIIIIKKSDQICIKEGQSPNWTAPNQNRTWTIPREPLRNSRHPILWQKEKADQSRFVILIWAFWMQQNFWSNHPNRIEMQKNTREKTHTKREFSVENRLRG